MASETEIANLAAARIGTASRITSLDDNRTLARTLKAVWAIERQATLRDGSWNFSSKREALAALAAPGEVIYPWAYAYRMPAESLRLREVLDLAPGERYELAADGRILIDRAGPLYVRFSIDVPEMAKWDASAAEAFALRLAWRIGRKIAGSMFDQQACWAEYRDALGRAGFVDASENPGVEQAESGWIEARMGGAW